MMKKPNVKHNSRSEFRYSLCLADGHGLELVAPAGLGAFIREYARILRLSPCMANRLPRVIYSRNQKGRSWEPEEVGKLALVRKENLPGTGWKSQDRGGRKIWLHPEVQDAICEVWTFDLHFPFLLEFSLLPLFQSVRGAGGFWVHSALLEKDGKGLLLTAPPGTGKSTCCRRIPSPWKALADDEAAVVRDRKGRYWVHPFPTYMDYCGGRSRKTWDVQRSVPLSAVFFLAKGECDEVSAVGGGTAAAFLFCRAREKGFPNMMRPESTADKGGNKIIFENICQLTKAIPCYRLQATLEGRFWEEMEKVL